MSDTNAYEDNPDLLRSLARGWKAERGARHNSEIEARKRARDRVMRLDRGNTNVQGKDVK